MLSLVIGYFLMVRLKLRNSTLPKFSDDQDQHATGEQGQSKGATPALHAEYVPAKPDANALASTVTLAVQALQRNTVVPDCSGSAGNDRRHAAKASIVVHRRGAIDSAIVGRGAGWNCGRAGAD